MYELRMVYFRYLSSFLEDYLIDTGTNNVSFDDLNDI